MSSHLDKMLDHYLAAAVQQANVFERESGWQGQLTYLGHELVASAKSELEVLAGLRALVERRVFDAMRSGRALPVISGINITPGSC